MAPHRARGEDADFVEALLRPSGALSTALPGGLPDGHRDGYRKLCHLPSKGPATSAAVEASPALRQELLPHRTSILEYKVRGNVLPDVEVAQSLGKGAGGRASGASSSEVATTGQQLSKCVRLFIFEDQLRG